MEVIDVACFRPVEAVQDGFGRLRLGHGIQDREQGRPMWIPCGYCIGCRLQRTRTWGVRCMHEAQMHEETSFITLTYDEKNYRVGLEYEDFRLFLKRLREIRKIRYFVSGEYGSLNERPHWHALIFGYDFGWSARLKKTGVEIERAGMKPIGTNIRRSEILERLWPHGYSTVGEITQESAMYAAKYACKRVYGMAADSYYSRVDIRTGECVKVVPEFAQMSRRPGIGETWFNKYWREVYAARDGVTQKGGKTTKAPRYYDKLLEKTQPDLREYKDLERYVRAGEFLADCTPERLRQREICAEANIQRKRSSL